MKTSTIRITCPVCGRGRLFDAVNSAAAAKIELCGPSELDKAEWITKCPKCGNQIGISAKPAQYDEMQQPGA